MFLLSLLFPLHPLHRSLQSVPLHLTNLEHLLARLLQSYLLGPSIPLLLFVLLHLYYLCFHSNQSFLWDLSDPSIQSHLCFPCFPFLPKRPSALCYLSIPLSLIPLFLLKDLLHLLNLSHLEHHLLPLYLLSQFLPLLQLSLLHRLHLSRLWVQ